MRVFGPQTPTFNIVGRLGSVLTFLCPRKIEISLITIIHPNNWSLTTFLPHLRNRGLVHPQFLNVLLTQIQFVFYSSDLLLNPFKTKINLLKARSITDFLISLFTNCSLSIWFSLWEVSSCFRRYWISAKALTREASADACATVVSILALATACTASTL